MILRAWYGFWIWLLFATDLRRWLNDRQRRLASDDATPKKALVSLSHPSKLVQHLDGFDWRKDGSRIGGIFWPMDFVSHSQVFEARLADGKPYDGDCDDFAHYACVQLLRMDGVEAAYHVSVGYPGGGHIACVYLFERSWYLMNYSNIDKLPNGPHDAAALLMKWADHEGRRPRWFFFEDVQLRRVRL